jgi:hypothetical protein
MLLWMIAQARIVEVRLGLRAVQGGEDVGQRRLWSARMRGGLEGE